MDNSQAKDLFHLQTDLIDTKVNMAVSNAIDRVLDRIDSLDRDMNERFAHLDKDMNQRFAHLDKDMNQRFAQLEGRFAPLEHRVSSTEDSLRSLNDILGQIKAKFIEYGFKSAWFVSSAIIVYALSQLRFLIK